MSIEHRPWGSYETIKEEPGQYKVKHIIVQPNKRLSLQSHAHRAEHWVIVKGTASKRRAGKLSFNCLLKSKIRVLFCHYQR